MWKNLSYSIWLSLLGAIFGAIASAYVSTSITRGISALQLFLLGSVLGAGIFLVVTRIIVLLRSLNIYFHELKRKADFYDQFHNQDSIRFLGPPHTNGVMGLSPIQKKIIKAHFCKIKSEFIPSRGEEALSTYSLVVRYNTAHPDFPINGDTAEMLVHELEGEKIS